MRIWQWIAIWLVGGLLIGCNPQEDPTPSATPTLAPPTATVTPSPTTPPPTPTDTPSPTPTEIPLAARVNGQPILLADFERELARAGDAATPQQVLDGMIEMVLLEQAVAASGITITDEEVDAIVQADIESNGREAFEAWLAANDMSEDEYWTRVRENLLAERVQEQIPGELPDTAEHVHARHILVATQQEAAAILAQIQNGADFATLAQTHSQDVSNRDRGGDLDFFPRGLLLAPELEEAAFAMAPGEIAIVHSELFGYHVIQVLERAERQVSEQVREAIEANQRAGARRWREQLWADATVERFVGP